MKFIILSIIWIIERIENFNKHFLKDESDKIQFTLDISNENIQVLTDTDFEHLSHIHITKPYRVYKISTKHHTIECADKHIFFDAYMNQIYAKDIYIGMGLKTIYGNESVTSIEISNYSLQMFDVTVNHPNHRLYENGFLCHQTTTSSIFIAWYLCFQYDKNAFFLANKGATTAEVVKKTKNVMQYLPFFLKPGIVSLNVYSMAFDNGCSLQAQTTTENSGIGFTIHMLYLDEFAHVPSNIVDSFWENVYPTLSSSKISRIIITSTPNGFNKFYDIYTEATEGKNTFKPKRIDWWQVPGRDEDWKKREIKNLGSLEAFNEQYGNQFYKASTILLDSEILKTLRENSTEYVSCKNYFDAFEFDDTLNEHSQYLTFHPNFDLDNISKDYFVFSVDIAEGDGGDYSIINIFRLEIYKDLNAIKNADTMFDYIRLVQVGVFRNNRTDIDYFSKLLYVIIMHIFNPNNCKLIVEYNTYGSDIINRLQTVFGDNNDWDDEVFVKYKHKNESQVSKVGLRLKSDNKIIICQEFKKYASKFRIVLNEEKTVEESFYFGKTKNGGYATTHKYDDLIMSAINATTIFNTIEFSDLAEEFLDTLDSNELNKIESHYGSSNTNNTNFNIYDVLPITYTRGTSFGNIDFDI